MESATADVLSEARDALGRHAWSEAFDLFNRADQTTQLAGTDLQGLADAAWFLGQSDLSIAVKERAFQAFQAAGDKQNAAGVALDLQTQYGYKGQPSIAAAWFRRGEKLLEGEPEGYAHGFLKLAQASQAPDIDAALKLFDEAAEIGTRTNAPDLRALALSRGGYTKVGAGAVAEGFAMLEESAISAVTGELSPFAAGVSCCNMISCCRDLTDYQRAKEWIEATERFCESQSVSGFPGICRVHKAEVVALTGAWAKAESELRTATTELAAYNAIPPMADGFYAIGEIRLRMGDLDGAEEALRTAHGLGKDPQPALARIRLAQGKVKQAETAISSALAENLWDRASRTRLLPAAIEIFVASGNLASARESVEQLDQLVETFDSPAMQAARHEGWGRVLLAEGDGSGASRRLREAVATWRKIGAPYEVARARALLSMALRATGDEEGADLELATARDDFKKLGAEGAMAEVDKAIQAVDERRSKPIQARKAFMFTDIVGSTNLAELLGDEGWDQLLKWHDEALRSQFLRHGGEVVNSTGDGFFVAFESPQRGIDCAIAIQQTLAEHRRSTGFAPSVRIGLHLAEANRHGGDYSGVGVHVAARVAALGGAGDIIASVDTLREVGNIESTDEREALLKGVALPVRVAKVLWQ
jgi:class 3 adenylate cyclase